MTHTQEAEARAAQPEAPEKPRSGRSKKRATAPSPSPSPDVHPNAPAGGDFDLNDDGQKYHSQKNIRLAIAKLGIRLRYNLMSLRSEVCGMTGFGPDFNDAEMDHLWLLIDEQFQFRVGYDLYRRVAEDAARRDSYHPVREYLDGLRWDLTPRLAGWLTSYGGAKRTDYSIAIGNLILTAAVRRVRQPGCKFDEMVVLESAEQGKFKSSALRVLAVKDEWFTDQLPLGESSRTMMEATGGRWIVECGELRGMNKADEKWLKNYLAAQSDHGRPAYARKNITVPRQFVPFGTTNETRDYLADDTSGNRRFWPVRIDRFDIDKLRADRDQLWAEAAHREALGDSIRLDSALYEAAGAEQEDRRQRSPFEFVLAERLRSFEGRILVTDAWRIAGIPHNRPTTQQEMAAIGKAMKHLGWKHGQTRVSGAKPTTYTKGDSEVWIGARWNEKGMRWYPTVMQSPPEGEAAEVDPQDSTASPA